MVAFVLCTFQKGASAQQLTKYLHRRMYFLYPRNLLDVYSFHPSTLTWGFHQKNDGISISEMILAL